VTKIFLPYFALRNRVVIYIKYYYLNCEMIMYVLKICNSKKTKLKSTILHRKRKDDITIYKSTKENKFCS